jgi:hypothetical protein
MSQSIEEGFYVSINNTEDEEFDFGNISEIVPNFEPKDDGVDKFLKIYGKDSVLTKLIFSIFLMNPLLKILCSCKNNS